MSVGHREVMTVVGRDRGVLVTGATSGLGRAVALRFASENVPVACVGRREVDLRQTVREVERRGARAVALRADLADTASLTGVVDRAVAELDRSVFWSTQQPPTHPAPPRISAWTSGTASWP